MTAEGDPYFFEGPEKLLEVWFEGNNQPGMIKLAKFGTPVNRSPESSAIHSPSTSPRVLSPAPTPGNSPLRSLSRMDSASFYDKGGLRSISRENYEAMLSLVRCTILGSSSNEYIDSYVLSESSMFVAPFRLILKTCGKTSLLAALPKLIELASEVGLTKITELFYSRRSYSRPDLQLFPHRDFDEEIAYLRQHFVEGENFTLGNASEDSWHLFALNRRMDLDMSDRTFEIIMRDLDPIAMQQFYKTEGRNGTSVTLDTGIGDLFPLARTEEFLFDPCGYSVNGVLKDGYFTIHVTPQSEFSYVSFETDIDMVSYDDLTRKVLAIFKPNRFIATLFSNRSGDAVNPAISFGETPIQGYTQTESCIKDLKSYSLNYTTYSKVLSA